MFNSAINSLKFVLKLLLVLFLVLIQICYFFIFIKFLKIRYIIYFLKLISIFFIINNKQSNSFKILWIILLAFLPIIFIPVYFFSLLKGIIFSKYNKNVESKFKIENLENKDILNYIDKNNKLLGNLSKFITSSYNTGFRYCDEYVYYNNGADFFSDFIKNLKDAKKYIFIDFFILSKGIMWNDIRDIIIEKINLGVDVYIMFDSLGSFFRYPRSIKKIRHNRFHLVIYNTLLKGIGPYLSSRNHRKIVVIDGKIGYIAGLNIGDEYINNGNFKYKWKDSAIKVNNNIVNDLVNMFIELWNNSSSEKITNIDKFMNNCSGNNINKNNGYIMLYGDSAFDKYNISKNVYTQLINIAENYLYIMTPYLILDEDIKNSLIRASKSGVDIRVVTPKKPDNILVHTVTRSYYMELIEAGIEIFEYSPGFIHSKCILSDDNICIIGSVNFDFRSMYMLYENSILTYEVEQLSNIKQDFIDTFEKSEKIEQSKWERRNIFEKIGESVLKIFAPLL